MQGKNIYSDDFVSGKEPIAILREKIENPAAVIDVCDSPECAAKGKAFADEIAERFVADFEKDGDKMVHVSTFLVVGGTLYVTYYANTKESAEDPENQTARFVFCPLDDVNNKTFFDIQTVGDECGGKIIDHVYDTIMMQKDPGTIYIMWTARADGNYYRFYRTYSVADGTMSEVRVNRFRVGDVVNDFGISGIQSALTANGIGFKRMFNDVGIMQKLSSRIENGCTYYYSGAYSGDFNCIIRSRDLVTWEYVAQPDFHNESKWENATYATEDKCFYFVRQHDETQYGFLTAYNFGSKTWDKPVLIGDCQSRSDFIEYGGELFLFHAPKDREHIGIIRIDTDDVSKSRAVLQADMRGSCFYPFVQYFADGELAMSYTIDRIHIRLARFTLSKYFD